MIVLAFGVHVFCAALCAMLAAINIRQGNFGFATVCAATVAFSIFLAKIALSHL